MVGRLCSTPNTMPHLRSESLLNVLTLATDLGSLSNRIILALSHLEAHCCSSRILMRHHHLSFSHWGEHLYHDAGQQAIDYFEGYYPDLPPFGEDNAGNQAEWLVNITTKVWRPEQQLRASIDQHRQDAPSLHKLASITETCIQALIALLRVLDSRHEYGC